MRFVLLLFSPLLFSCLKRFDSEALLFRHISVSLLDESSSESDSLLLALIFCVDLDRCVCNLIKSLYSCVSGSIKSFDLRVNVDFLVLAFVISF